MIKGQMRPLCGGGDTATAGATLRMPCAELHDYSNAADVRERLVARVGVALGPAVDAVGRDLLEAGLRHLRAREEGGGHKHLKG